MRGGGIWAHGVYSSAAPAPCEDSIHQPVSSITSMVLWPLVNPDTSRSAGSAPPHRSQRPPRLLGVPAVLSRSHPVCPGITEPSIISWGGGGKTRHPFLSTFCSLVLSRAGGEMDLMLPAGQQLVWAPARLRWLVGDVSSGSCFHSCAEEPQPGTGFVCTVAHP